MGPPPRTLFPTLLFLTAIILATAQPGLPPLRDPPTEQSSIAFYPSCWNSASKSELNEILTTSVGMKTEELIQKKFIWLNDDRDSCAIDTKKKFRDDVTFLFGLSRAQITDQNPPHLEPPYIAFLNSKRYDPVTTTTTHLLKELILNEFPNLFPTGEIPIIPVLCPPESKLTLDASELLCDSEKSGLYLRFPLEEVGGYDETRLASTLSKFFTSIGKLTSKVPSSAEEKESLGIKVTCDTSFISDTDAHPAQLYDAIDVLESTLKYHNLDYFTFFDDSCNPPSPTSPGTESFALSSTDANIIINAILTPPDFNRELDLEGNIEESVTFGEIGLGIRDLRTEKTKDSYRLARYVSDFITFNAASYFNSGRSLTLDPRVSNGLIITSRPCDGYLEENPDQSTKILCDFEIPAIKVTLAIPSDTAIESPPNNPTMDEVTFVAIANGINTFFNQKFFGTSKPMNFIYLTSEHFESKNSYRDNPLVHDTLVETYLLLLNALEIQGEQGKLDKVFIPAIIRNEPLRDGTETESHLPDFLNEEQSPATLSVNFLPVEEMKLAFDQEAQNSNTLDLATALERSLRDKFHADSIQKIDLNCQSSNFCDFPETKIRFSGMWVTPDYLADPIATALLDYLSNLATVSPAPTELNPEDINILVEIAPSTQESGMNAQEATEYISTFFNKDGIDRTLYNFGFAELDKNFDVGISDFNRGGLLTTTNADLMLQSEDIRPSRPIEYIRRGDILEDYLRLKPEETRASLRTYILNYLDTIVILDSSFDMGTPEDERRPIGIVYNIPSDLNRLSFDLAQFPPPIVILNPNTERNLGYAPGDLLAHALGHSVYYLEDTQSKEYLLRFSPYPNIWESEQNCKNYAKQRLYNENCVPIGEAKRAWKIDDQNDIMSLQPEKMNGFSEPAITRITWVETYRAGSKYLFSPSYDDANPTRPELTSPLVQMLIKKIPMDDGDDLLEQIVTIANKFGFVFERADKRLDNLLALFSCYFVADNFDCDGDGTKNTDEEDFHSPDINLVGLQLTPPLDASGPSPCVYQPETPYGLDGCPDNNDNGVPDLYESSSFNPPPLSEKPALQKIVRKKLVRDNDPNPADNSFDLLAGYEEDRRVNIVFVRDSNTMTKNYEYLVPSLIRALESQPGHISVYNYYEFRDAFTPFDEPLPKKDAITRLQSVSVLTANQFRRTSFSRGQNPDLIVILDSTSSASAPIETLKQIDMAVTNNQLHTHDVATIVVPVKDWVNPESPDRLPDPNALIFGIYFPHPDPTAQLPETSKSSIAFFLHQMGNMLYTLGDEYCCNGHYFPYPKGDYYQNPNNFPNDMIKTPDDTYLSSCKYYKQSQLGYTFLENAGRCKSVNDPLTDQPNMDVISYENTEFDKNHGNVMSTFRGDIYTPAQRPRKMFFELVHLPDRLKTMDGYFREPDALTQLRFSPHAIRRLLAIQWEVDELLRAAEKIAVDDEDLANYESAIRAWYLLATPAYEEIFDTFDEIRSSPQHWSATDDRSAVKNYGTYKVTTSAPEKPDQAPKLIFIAAISQMARFNDGVATISIDSLFPICQIHGDGSGKIDPGTRLLKHPCNFDRTKYPKDSNARIERLVKEIHP